MKMHPSAYKLDLATHFPQRQGRLFMNKSKEAVDQIRKGSQSRSNPQLEVLG